MSATHIPVRPADPHPDERDATLEPCGAPGHEDCGIRLVLDRLGEQWTVMTLAELSAGPRRYRELERALGGVSQRMMTLTLRRLERDGHVRRDVEATVPPSVTYELTELGRAFAGQVAALVTWSRQHKAAIEGAREGYDSRAKAPARLIRIG
ncbi:helix-turn-helix domain-containing protein [Rhizobium sp. SSA_523]|uniref:winged helix-turn-helix transcriptional regulator n=1 Tax=Rhizobium sp. SSA_523 TaxID=2952477 RepID=UPI0025B02C26|nr:helix-turn-helix domain-containing protein [Rhizobium sp. SSA_523]WKC25237.1 helix-turn-helix domain-containing protein [Rhizobium sp. SSA_523]